MLQTVLAVIATMCVVVSYIPQIVKGFRTKSLDDVSLAFLLLILIGTITWLGYAILRKDYNLLAANGIILVLVITLTGMKIYYDRR